MHGDGTGFDGAQTVVYGRAGFLATGHRLEGGHGAPSQTESRYWTSVDGVEWQEVPPPSQITSAWHDVLYTTPDGDYVVIANVSGESGDEVALRSSDGRTWEPVDSGLPARIDVGGVERGDLGYLLFGQQTSYSNPTLWLSDDGLAWERVQEFAQDETYVQLYDIGAGDEGFVVFGVRHEQGDGGASQGFAFASGDGREWVETPSPLGPEDPDHSFNVFVEALGPDWIATTMTPDDSATFWFSPDGIAWEPAGTIGSLSINALVDPVLINAEGTLYFSTGGEPLPGGGSGAWSSADGRTWTEIPLDEGVVSDAAAGAGVTVLTGNRPQGEGSVAVIWARPS